MQVRSIAECSCPMKHSAILSTCIKQLQVLKIYFLSSFVWLLKTGLIVFLFGISGAFMGTGESAVANNIINQTHRIQFWDFTKLDIPDITNGKLHVVQNWL